MNNLPEEKKKQENLFYAMYILSPVFLIFFLLVLRYTVGAHIILPENEGTSVKNEESFVLCVRILYFIYFVLFLLFLPKVKEKLSVVFPSFVFCTGFVFLYVMMLYNGWVLFVAPFILFMIIPAAVIGRLVTRICLKISEKRNSNKNGSNVQ